MVLALIVSVVVIVTTMWDGVFARQRQGTAPEDQEVTVTSAWDGVFTKEQADSGSEAYQKNCVACHSANLQSGPARALVGDTFWQDWGEDLPAALITAERDPATLNAARGQRIDVLLKPVKPAQLRALIAQRAASAE